MIVPANTVIIITPKINLLTYPILDEFYVPKGQRRSKPSGDGKGLQVWG